MSSSAAEGRRGGSASPKLPPAPRAAAALGTVTLDGSVLGAVRVPRGGSAAAAAADRGRPQPRRAGSGAPRSPAAAGQRIFLDKGEGEDGYLATLRSHFTRNSTAEPTGFQLNCRPARKYAAGANASPGSAAGGGLAQTEGALWAEREHELLDAQEARFAQLEGAIMMREAKRDDFVVHRLEAAAADKIEQLAAVRGRIAKQREALLQNARSVRLDARSPVASTVLPALTKSAQRTLLPPSPTLAAAVKEAKAGLGTLTHLSHLESGLQSKGAFAPPLAAAAPAPAAAIAAVPGQPTIQRAAWAERKQATYQKQLDAVYSSMQRLKSMKDGTAQLPLAASAPASALQPAQSTIKTVSRPTASSSGPSLPSEEAWLGGSGGSSVLAGGDEVSGRACSAAEPNSGEEVAAPAAQACTSLPPESQDEGGELAAEAGEQPVAEGPASAEEGGAGSGTTGVAEEQEEEDIELALLAHKAGLTLRLEHPAGSQLAAQAAADPAEAEPAAAANSGAAVSGMVTEPSPAAAAAPEAEPAAAEPTEDGQREAPPLSDALAATPAPEPTSLVAVAAPEAEPAAADQSGTGQKEHPASSELAEAAAVEATAAAAPLAAVEVPGPAVPEPEATTEAAVISAEDLEALLQAVAAEELAAQAAAALQSSAAAAEPESAAGAPVDEPAAALESAVPAAEPEVALSAAADEPAVDLETVVAEAEPEAAPGAAAEEPAVPAESAVAALEPEVALEAATEEPAAAAESAAAEAEPEAELRAAAGEQAAAEPEAVLGAAAGEPAAAEPGVVLGDATGELAAVVENVVAAAEPEAALLAAAGEPAAAAENAVAVAEPEAALGLAGTDAACPAGSVEGRAPAGLDEGEPTDGVQGGTLILGEQQGAAPMSA